MKGGIGGFVLALSFPPGIDDALHQGNLAERIMHYNLHGGVDNGISGIIIPCQPLRGDYNALSFLLNFPDVIVSIN